MLRPRLSLNGGMEGSGVDAAMLHSRKRGGD